MTGVFQSLPGQTDDDIEFASDMAYLKELANEVVVGLYAGANGRLADGFLNGQERSR
jgi:hypothetical protein